MFGDVFLSEDKAGCALILLPDKKKTTLKSISLDIKLILTCMGLSNAKKAMDREAKIKKLHPDGLMYLPLVYWCGPKSTSTRGLEVT